MTRTVVSWISRPRGRDAVIAFGIRARPESVGNLQNTPEASSLNLIELTQSSTSEPPRSKARSISASAGNRTRASPDGGAAGSVRRRTSGNVVVTVARGSAPNLSSTDSPPRNTPLDIEPALPHTYPVESLLSNESLYISLPPAKSIRPTSPETKGAATLTPFTTGQVRTAQSPSTRVEHGSASTVSVKRAPRRGESNGPLFDCG